MGLNQAYHLRIMVEISVLLMYLLGRDNDMLHKTYSLKEQGILFQVSCKTAYHKKELESFQGIALNSFYCKEKKAGSILDRARTKPS